MRGRCLCLTKQFLDIISWSNFIAIELLTIGFVAFFENLQTPKNMDKQFDQAEPESLPCRNVALASHCALLKGRCGDMCCFCGGMCGKHICICLEKHSLHVQKHINSLKEVGSKANTWNNIVCKIVWEQYLKWLEHAASSGPLTYSSSKHQTQKEPFNT